MVSEHPVLLACVLACPALVERDPFAFLPQTPRYFSGHFSPNHFNPAICHKIIRGLQVSIREYPPLCWTIEALPLKRMVD